MKKSRKETKKSGLLDGVRYMFDTSVELDRRIVSILCCAAAAGNTLGFLANFFLYGMNIPTAVCAVCDLLVLLNLFFGLRSRYYLILGGIMLGMLDIIEFPLLVFTYGAVMYPYMVLGFVAMIPLVYAKRWRIFALVLGAYDAALIVFSSLHPYIFGAQDAAGLMGSAVITFIITISALTVCVTVWQSVSVTDTTDIDPLTRLFSRTGFMSKIKDILENDTDTDLSILYFDIQNFKSINALYGVDGGNSILCQVAESLRSSTLEPLLTARFNADRFVCLAETKKINYDVLNSLCRASFSGRGKTTALLLNCGVYSIENRTTPLEAMCDRARAAAKYIHGGQSERYCIYNYAIAEAFREETEVLAEIEQALGDEVFEPFYQPIVEAKTGKVVSAEALARWVHPELGLISPGVFIPVLERKELISNLDIIIARKVDRLLQVRAAAGSTVVPVSVNLSRVDLYDDALMEQLQTMLNSSLLKKHHRIEVTESSYETLSENELEKLSMFRELGAQILVDDFGSGYSSLGMITEYDFDIIKLDFKFASKIETNEKIRDVIRSLIDMVHKLGAKVVAEGVETAAQHDFLVSCDCDYIQGFYFYKPMPEPEFIELLDRQ